MSIRTVDLFCGVGGLSLGFKKAGFDIVGSFDSWERAISLYKRNFKHHADVMDLSEPDKVIPKIQELNPDMIIGGPPCQDFSHAGKRNEGGRANLTLCYAQVVTSIAPKYFLMENVDRAQKSMAYQSARALFKANGYGLTEVVLDASMCGVPQKRKRFFCIGVKDGEDFFFEGALRQAMSEKSMTVRDYLGNEIDFEHYYRHPRNYNRRAVFSIDEPAPTMRGVNRPVPPNYPGHHGDTFNAQEVRPLTTLERARVRTFPASFEWDGTKTDMEQMIGNAVPVNLAKFVGKAVQKMSA